MSEPERPQAAPGRTAALDHLLPPALLFLGVLGTIPVVRSLWVPDLNWCYRYLSPDSYDWLNNGVYWAGAPVVPSFRAPGLPLVMAGLYRLGALSWLPALNFVLLGATAVLLYRVLGKRFQPSVAALSAWAFYANGYLQDFARWIMAEVWAVFFLVLATLFFVRAGAKPRIYLFFGLAVGVSFLFHYAALPAGVGFAAAVLLQRREHLRLRELWVGAAASIGPPALWLAVRSWHHHRHPAGPWHGVESLIRFVPQNLGFYAFVAVALLGLLVLPLYVAGVLRCLDRSGRKERLLRGVFSPILAALGLFFGLFYDWTDKRFLLYVLPYALGFFALGLEVLIAWGARTPPLRVVAGAYLLAALAWNQITYPPYGIQFLALTPRDFLEAASVQDATQKTSLHLAGARLVRLHERVAGAFSGGLFDHRLRPAGCRLDLESHKALLSLRPDLDRILGRGAPLGLYVAGGSPSDYWSSVNRLSNVLERPIVRPDQAPCSLAVEELPGKKTLLVARPYFFGCEP